ncbi:PREDICTED: protein inturned-like, partial [Priapulus caudatus]|uniref:Protein inturned n=1 Tax=Priapulus caudatus TaxID=37621 RepID=A0ABM1E583_PRICU
MDVSVANGNREKVSDSTDSDSIEIEQPEWAAAVQDRGDLFYVEGKSSAERIAAPVESKTNGKTNEMNTVVNNNYNKVKGLVNKTKHETDILRDLLTDHVPHSVSFYDSPTGKVIEVYLDVDPTRRNYGRRASRCETLFGIIPGHFSEKDSNGLSNRDSVDDLRIMVQGLLPSGEAERSGNVKLGDWLRCINDFEINYNNVNSILSAIVGPKRVKLTLQRFDGKQRSPHVARKEPINAGLVKLVAGQRLQEVTSALQEVPNHIVLYLTLEGVSENAQGKEDVLYQYPAVENKLVEIRGMFITLVHMMHDVTASSPISSSLLIDGKLVHVAYSREGREALVLGLPADRVPLYQLKNTMEDVVRLMKVLYKSLGSAFGDRENKPALDHLFSLLFQQLLLDSSPTTKAEDKLMQTPLFCSAFLESLQAVRWLPLPDSVMVRINNSLSDLEAADFVDMSEEFYSIRRFYTILGTCLFHKGYLIANHLPKEDLLDVALYLQYYHLLVLTSGDPVGQVVVWKEVFPTRRHQGADEPVIAGYTEPDGRWFLLIVGMMHDMLAVLLEAGGCATAAEGAPKPDPFYVDQVKNTLLELQAGGLAADCETKLQSPSIPALTAADYFLKTASKSDKKAESSPKPESSPSQRASRTDAPASILKKRPPSQQSSAASLGSLAQAHDRDSDEESEASMQSGAASDNSHSLREAETPPHPRKLTSTPSDESGSSIFKANKKKRTMISATSLTSLKKSMVDLTVSEDDTFPKLTRGCENTLFHYLSTDVAEGVFVCPVTSGSPSCPLQKQVVTNFNTCCMAIRTVLQQSTRRSAQGGKFSPDDSLEGVGEHGILFSCPTEGKRGGQEITYWVVG